MELSTDIQALRRHFSGHLLEHVLRHFLGILSRHFEEVRYLEWI